MHTIIVTLIGLALLGFFVGFAKAKDTAARRFIAVWLVLCIGHLTYGVVVAGYGLLTELGVHAVVFGVPAALAFTLSRVLRPKG
jgi:hypothetical protein